MTQTADHTKKAESAIPVGTVVDGYRVERVISVRDGLHTLVDATRPDGERVTLKLFAAPLEGKELRRQATKLAKVQASIAHPHVLPLVGDGKSRERFCLTGAPPGAVTLADRLRDGPLGAEEAVTLLSQVAGALETGRRHGLVHRALSPAAIIVTTDGPPRALLTDFGIAVPDAPGCRLTGAIQDADYRSPEEIRGEAPTRESTVYSLACILVACLTGDPPYPYHRPLLALQAHLVEAPPRISERDSGIAPELDEVVAKAMAKDPRDRYDSPAALMKAVQRALGVEAPIPGPSPPKPQAVPRAAKRSASAPRAVQPAAPPPARASGPPPGKAARDETEHKHKTAETADRTRPHTPEPVRRERRGARRARKARAGGWSTVRRLAPTWAGIALIASALAGFATGNGGADESKQPVTAASAPVEPSSRSVAEASSPLVGPAVERLDEQRVAARRRLRAARRPAGQKAVATHLAEIYRDTRRTIVEAPGQVRLESRLDEGLANVERAYRELAAAARRGPDAWRLASEAVLDRERDFELLLRTHSWV